MMSNYINGKKLKEKIKKSNTRIQYDNQKCQISRYSVITNNQFFIIFLFSIP